MAFFDAITISVSSQVSSALEKGSWRQNFARPYNPNKTNHVFVVVVDRPCPNNLGFRHALATWVLFCVIIVKLGISFVMTL